MKEGVHVVKVPYLGIYIHIHISQIHYMYFATLMFWGTCLVSVIVTFITEPPEEWRVSFPSLTNFGRIFTDDMKPFLWQLPRS